MFLTRPVFSAVTLILFLSLCCRTGSLLTVAPLNQVRFAPDEASMTCHYNSQCTNPSWSGPALSDTSRTSTTEVDRSSTLTIRDLKEEDQGQYNCSCNGNSVMSDLIVNHYPNVENVSRNQTFFRGRTISVACNSSPGQPEEQLLWIKDGNSIITDPSSRVRRDGNHVVIENISDDDSGTYVCGYIAAIGFINAEIMVNVIEAPPNIPNPMLPAETSYMYNESQPLEISCDEHLLDDPNSDSYSYSWVVRNEFTIPRPHLSIPHDEVLPGFHNCFIQVESGQVFEYPVFVNVVSTPPIVSDHRPVWPVMVNEYGTLYLEIPLRFELDSEISYQWQNSRGDQDVRFRSRVSYSVTGKTVYVTINEVKLSDRGRYQFVISNQYGSDDITVDVTVTKLIRTPVEAKFTHLPCDQIEAVEEIIADAFECEICGTVWVDSSTVEVTPECAVRIGQEERVERLLQFALVAQDRLPPIPSSSLQEALTSAQVSAEVKELCLDECQSPTTTTTPPSISSTPPTVQPFQTSDPALVTAVVVVVTVASTVCLVLLVATLLWRCQKFRTCSNKYRVGENEAEQPRRMEEGMPNHPPVPMQPAFPANAPLNAHPLAFPANALQNAQCTGYMTCQHPPLHPQVAVGGAGPNNGTPVCVPYTGQVLTTHVLTGPHLPPGTAPLPAAPATSSVLDTNSKPRRPARLLIRSHSCHAGTTRTPPA